MRVKLFFVMAVALLWSASVFAKFPMGSFETGNDVFGVCSDRREFLSRLLRRICDGRGGRAYGGEGNERKWVGDTLCLYSATRQNGAS